MASKDTEIVFDVVQEQDGGFVADCLNEDIITQGDSWEELRNNVREAVSAFFFDSTPPAKIRLSSRSERARYCQSTREEP